MRRLIDTDVFKSHINEVIKKQNGKNIDLVPVGELLTFIDSEPTAYDPDKVVEQLEEVEKIMTSPVNEDCFGEECRASDCTVCLISRAIDIVKAGGVDGN